jgi:hypothetical protein
LDAEKLAEQLHVALEAKEAAERDLAVTKAMLSGVQSRLDDAHALLSRAAVAPAKPAPRPSRKKPVA